MKAASTASFIVVRFVVPGAFGPSEFRTELEARDAARRLARVRGRARVYRVIGEPLIGLWRETKLIATFRGIDEICGYAPPVASNVLPLRRR